MARGPAPRNSNAVKQLKENNVEQAAVAAPAAAPIPLVLPFDLYSDWGGGQDDGRAVAGDANPAGGAAQQSNTTQGPELTAGDPQTTAFMMRMQVAAAADGSTLQQGVNAGIPGIKQAGEADSQDAPALPQTVGQTESALAAFGQGRQAEFGAEIKQAAAPSQAPELRALRADDPPQAPKPVNNILLQVNQSADEKVLVRLVQQSGELRLAVHTDDTALASGLQQGLSDLVGKLQGNGYRADTWHPVQSSVAANPAMESQSASNYSRQGDAQPQYGGSPQDGGQQQKNNPDRPRWAEELEFSLTSKEQAPGETYGFSS
jgi:hypothetical protein